MMSYLGMLNRFILEQGVLKTTNRCTEGDMGFAHNNLRILTDDASTQMMPTRDNIVKFKLNSCTAAANYGWKID
jgi:hypothetical protein